MPAALVNFDHTIYGYMAARALARLIPRSPVAVERPSRSRAHHQPVSTHVGALHVFQWTTGETVQCRDSGCGSGCACTASVVTARIHLLRYLLERQVWAVGPPVVPACRVLHYNSARKFSACFSVSIVGQHAPTTAHLSLEFPHGILCDPCNGFSPLLESGSPLPLSLSRAPLACTQIHAYACARVQTGCPFTPCHLERARCSFASRRVNMPVAPVVGCQTCLYVCPGCGVRRPVPADYASVWARPAERPCFCAGLRSPISPGRST